MFFDNNCICNLYPKGAYPMTNNFNEKNITFLKWIDNLRYLPVFSKWRFESPNISEPNITYDEFIFDKPSNKFLD